MKRAYQTYNENKKSLSKSVQSWFYNKPKMQNLNVPKTCVIN